MKKVGFLTLLILAIALATLAFTAAAAPKAQPASVATPVAVATPVPAEPAGFWVKLPLKLQLPTWLRVSVNRILK